MYPHGRHHLPPSRVPGLRLHNRNLSPSTMRTATIGTGFLYSTKWHRGLEHFRPASDWTDGSRLEPHAGQYVQLCSAVSSRSYAVKTWRAFIEYPCEVDGRSSLRRSGGLMEQLATAMLLAVDRNFAIPQCPRLMPQLSARATLADSILVVRPNVCNGIAPLLALRQPALTHTLRQPAIRHGPARSSLGCVDEDRDRWSATGQQENFDYLTSLGVVTVWSCRTAD